MRTHSTRAKPMSISRAARNGNASFDRSTRRERLHQLARARPLHVDLRVPEVTSVTNACASSGKCRFIHVSTWRCAVSEATTQKRSSSSLVTVRSAWSLPASLSHCVYVIVARRRRRRCSPRSG